MCTGIKINYKDGCVIGRTMDLENPVNYNVVYLPRNYIFSKDLMGDLLEVQYKILGISFENRDQVLDGVNEHGLIGVTNDFKGFNLYSSEIDPEKKNISSLDYFTYALGNYRSVEELVEDLPNIHISIKDYNDEKVPSPHFHFMFSDSTKRCVVIETKKRELVCYENPYDVMTNSPGFDTHVSRLKNLIDLDNLEDFNASKDLPGGYDPVSRFIKAFYLTKMNVESKDYKEGLANAYNIMGAMTMPEGFVRNKKYDYYTYTRYISIYDTKNKLLTVKSHSNPMVYRLGFEDISNKDKRQEFFLNLEFDSKKLKDK